MSTIDPNEPCPCGSGLLHRDCCGRLKAREASQRRNRILTGIALISGFIAVMTYMNRMDEEKLESITLPEGAYYDEDHAHWHYEGTNEEIHLPGKVWDPVRKKWLNVKERPAGEHGETALQPQPDGPVPDGKVWSGEHGHWHDITPAEGGVPAPEGEAPAGKEWSPEHGHYHDIEHDHAH